MTFGVAAFSIVRDTESEAKRELARITDVKQSAAGYDNYQQWLAGTNLDRKVSLEDYSVTNRGLASGWSERRRKCRNRSRNSRPRAPISYSCNPAHSSKKWSVSRRLLFAENRRLNPTRGADLIFLDRRWNKGRTCVLPSRRGCNLGAREAHYRPMTNAPDSPPRRPFFSTLFLGLIAGVLAGLAMLLTMALLRSFLGWPTPTELIFDRLFPLLTVEFFIGSLVKAGGYTPLKLQGVFGALAGQVVVAGLGGAIYALYLRRKATNAKRPDDYGIIDPRGWSLIIPGVLAATVLFIALLWPTLITNYRGFPPGTARLICALEMLVSFSVCGFGITFFADYSVGHGSVRSCGRINQSPAPRVGLRRFLALGIGGGGGSRTRRPAETILCHRYLWLRRPAVRRTEGAEDYPDQAGG